MASSLKLCSDTDQILLMSGKTIYSASKVVTLLLCIVMVSCKTENINFSNVPSIEFESIKTVKDISGKDSIIEIELYYQDGDGNIGLSENDTNPPFNYGGLYYHNLPIIYQVKKGNEFEEVTHPISNEVYGNQHERVPILTPDGRSKSISGILKVILTANPFDTKPTEVQFELKLIDRELNISNTVITPSIQLIH